MKTSKRKPTASKAKQASAADAPAQTPPTVSHILGEMTWLLTQSPLHSALSIGDLEWLIMPPLLHEQFYIFRDGNRPVGLALWAICGRDAASKLERGMIEPENRLTLEEWVGGDQIWLVDLIAPFANAENRHREIMMADLIAGPLAGKAFSFHLTDPGSGKRTVKQVPADANQKLKAVLEAALGPAS